MQVVLEPITYFSLAEKLFIFWLQNIAGNQLILSFQSIILFLFYERSGKTIQNQKPNVSVKVQIPLKHYQHCPKQLFGPLVSQDSPLHLDRQTYVWFAFSANMDQTNVEGITTEEIEKVTKWCKVRKCLIIRLGVTDI